MGDFRQAYQIETIKAQTRALIEKGCAVNFQLNAWQSLNPVAVTIMTGDQMYHFSDPDLDVIISQICTFHAGLNKKENHVTKFINLMRARHGKVQARG